MYTSQANVHALMGVISALSLLSTSDFCGWRVSLDFFTIGPTAPDISRAISRLCFLFPYVVVEHHHLPGFAAFLDWAGADKRYLELENASWTFLPAERVGVAVSRLFLPQRLAADWYLYSDIDVLFKRPLWPAVLGFAGRGELVVGAPDPGFIAWRFGNRDYLRRVRPEIAPEQYVNSGFQVWRGGAALNRALGRAADWVLLERNRTWFVDQDGLNFAIPRSEIAATPWWWMAFWPSWRDRVPLWPRPVVRHYAGRSKDAAWDAFRNAFPDWFPPPS